MKVPNIDVLFVAGFGPIVRDDAPSRKFYAEALGLSFKEDADGYLYTGELDGVKHLRCGRWRRPLSPALARINGPAIFPSHKHGWNLT